MNDSSTGNTSPTTSIIAGALVVIAEKYSLERSSGQLSTLSTKRGGGDPVVIMTSSNEERDKVEGYNLGVNSYIQKPVDFDQFRKTVKTLGLYWLVVNQSPIAASCSTTTGATD